MAWSVISIANRVCLSLSRLVPSLIMPHNQVLMNQKNRDQRIIRLAGAMRDAFDFTQDAKPLREKVEKHDKTITLLLQQVTECSHFISDYSKSNSFCQSSPASRYS